MICLISALIGVGGLILLAISVGLHRRDKLRQKQEQASWLTRI